jgi:hypothetical protein
MSVSVRRELALQLKKMYPKYGAISKLMQKVFQQLVEGRLKIK